MDIASAGISAGSGLLGGIFGLIGQNRQFRNQKNLIKQQYELQSKLNQETYLQNVEQWNRENEYNSPFQQMARLSEAGLNPNLIYGSTDGGTAARSPQLEPAQVGVAQAPNPADAYASAIQAATGGAQLAQSFAQADYTQALAKKAYAEAERLGYFNQHADELYSANAAAAVQKSLSEKHRVTLFEQQAGMNKTKAQLLSQELNNRMLEYEMKRNDFNFQIDTYDFRLDMIKTATAEALVRLENLKKQGKLTDANIQLVYAQYRNTTAIAIQNENNPYGFSGESGNIARAVKGGWEFISENIPESWKFWK